MGQLLESQIQDWILLPVLVVEVPPLIWIDAEAFCLEGPSKQFAMPALQRRSTGIKRVGPLRHFIVATRHDDRGSGLQIVKREIDGAAAVMT